MKKNFLGRGIQFPVGLDARGNLALSEFDDNIAESIHLILGTAIGERVMRPDFGCRIHDYVFHPNNPSTASLVGYYGREAIVKWEPRVDNVVVNSYPDPAEENVMRVEISYKVRRTNSIRNLVYPFYLRREQDL